MTRRKSRKKIKPKISEEKSDETSPEKIFDNADNPENPTNIESKITNLSILVDKYNLLSDLEKIQNINIYNNILANISEIKKLVDNIKTQFTNITPETNQDPGDLTQINNQINQIKKLDELENPNISDLLSNYKLLSEIQTKIKNHQNTKKMEIIYL